MCVWLGEEGGIGGPSEDDLQFGAELAEVAPGGRQAAFGEADRVQRKGTLQQVRQVRCSESTQGWGHV